MKKKNLLMFSRMWLADLYGNLAPKLSSKYNFIHVAFSNIEENILNDRYGIKSVANFRNYLDKLDDEIIDNKLLDKIDSLIIKTTENRFNLNSSIQSDRGFVYLEYGQTLKLIQLYYKFWIDIIKNYEIDMIFHETTSLLFNHLCSVIAKSKGIIYTDMIPMQGINEKDFIFFNYDNGTSIEFLDHYNNYEKIRMENVNKLISQIRNKNDSFLAAKNERSLVKLLYRTLKDEVKIKLNSFKKKY